MRWERLFADLEAGVEDDDLLERDALVEELVDEEWGRTSWTALLAGAVTLEVRGAGRLEGEVALVADHLVRLRAPGRDHVVSLAAVDGVTTDDRRATEPGLVASRLGWTVLLRAVREDDGEVRLVRTDGTVVAGAVDVVLADAVGVRVGRRRVLVPLAAVAVLTLEH